VDLRLTLTIFHASVLVALEWYNATTEMRADKPRRSSPEADRECPRRACSVAMLNEYVLRPEVGVDCSVCPGMTA
jgi:hypothetical protein